jgi:hypothetical protein
MEPQSFDILSYLNDIYLYKSGNQINTQSAGGHHNIHGDSNQTDEKILEINKKRINIPNAEIKPFSYRQLGDVEEYNEPSPTSSSTKSTRKNGTRRNEVSSETEQEGGFGGSITEEVIEI